MPRWSQLVMSEFMNKDHAESWGSSYCQLNSLFFQVLSGLRTVSMGSPGLIHEDEQMGGGWLSSCSGETGFPPPPSASLASEVGLVPAKGSRCRAQILIKDKFSHLPTQLETAVERKGLQLLVSRRRGLENGS